MAWIESHQALDTSPKLKRAARTLGISRPAMAGHLHFLWHWALDNAFDGDLSDFEADEIADAAEWVGDAHEFVEALVSCGPGDRAGFLERDGLTADGRRRPLVIHDWFEHTKHLREKREASIHANHQRWHVKRGVVEPSCGLCYPDGAPAESDSTPDGDPSDEPDDPEEIPPDSAGNPTGDPEGDPSGVPEEIPPESTDRTDRTDRTDPGAAEAAPSKPQRPRDELFEALTDVCGLTPDQLTKSERGRCNKAAKELRDVGATPDGIRARADVYRQRWPGVDLTPTALASNYNLLGTPSPSRNGRPPPDEPDEPGPDGYGKKAVM